MIGSSTALSDQLTHKLRLPADAMPLMEQRSKEETVAIFDELLSQMDGDTKTFYPQDEAQVESHSNAGMESGNETGGVREFVVANRRVQSCDVPKNRDVRPSSSTSLRKGEPPDGEGHPPRAASVETEMVFATLPKKKKKLRSKWGAGLKKLSSPLLRPLRKSFSNAPPVVPSTVHVSVTRPSPSVPIAPRESPILEDPSSPSRDSSRTSLPSMKNLLDRFSREGEGQRVEKVGVASVEHRKRGSVPRDKCLNSLKVMTTLSSNKECLNSLISYICLPKCVTK